MEPTLAGTIFAFLLLGAILWPIERLFPSIRGQRLWRSGIKTDLACLPVPPGVSYLVTKGRRAAAPAARAAATGRGVTQAARMLRIVEAFPSPFPRPMPKS